MGRRARLKPNQVSDRWPNTPVDDPVYETLRRYVYNLTEAIGDTSIKAAAERTQVNYSTLYAILKGETWPDAITVARTEEGLQARLWEGPASLPED